MEDAAKIESEPRTDMPIQEGNPAASGEVEFKTSAQHRKLFELALRQSIKGRPIEEIIAMLKSAAVTPELIKKQRRGKHFERFSEFKSRQRRRHRRKTGADAPVAAPSEA